MYILLIHLCWGVTNSFHHVARSFGPSQSTLEPKHGEKHLVQHVPRPAHEAAIKTTIPVKSIRYLAISRNMACSDLQ